MEVARLRAFLRQRRRIALDTSIFIYQLEANDRYLALTDHIFSWLEQPGSSAGHVNHYHDGVAGPALIVRWTSRG